MLRVADNVTFTKPAPCCLWNVLTHLYGSGQMAVFFKDQKINKGRERKENDMEEEKEEGGWIKAKGRGCW